MPMLKFRFPLVFRVFFAVLPNLTELRRSKAAAGGFVLQSGYYVPTGRLTFSQQTAKATENIVLPFSLSLRIATESITAISNRRPTHMSLRVISGQYRRRILKTPSDDSTRPYTDRVRQIVFDRLAHLIPNAKVADVFSGVGTMGLESLSRGAKSCVFFESNRDIHELLVSNVETIAPEARTICWKTDVRRTSFRPHGGEDCLPYSLIFFDPPYKTADEISPGKPLAASLKRLARDTISEADAVLILRTPEHFETPEVPLWAVHDCWELSSMMIWILTKPGAYSDETARESEDAAETTSPGLSQDEPAGPHSGTISHEITDT